MADEIFSPWRFCLAPMMQRTDRHFRSLLRVLAPNLRLYTEMVTSGAVLYGDRKRFLAYPAEQHPLALQLGGNDPADLAECTRIATDYGYDEVNLNCGCPSDRVQAGAFGACLMREPERVAAAVHAMRSAAPKGLAITVKTRLGVDELYHYDYLKSFVGQLADNGCEAIIVHARKAWLEGLSPRENREIPPLNYPWVHALKADFPQLPIVINGGINSIECATQQLRHVDGVMLGRHAYAEPWQMQAFDQALFASEPNWPSRSAALAAYRDYVLGELNNGVYLKHISRHLLNFYHGQPGARQWRRTLGEQAPAVNAGIEVLDHAIAAVETAYEAANRPLAAPV